MDIKDKELILREDIRRSLDAMIRRRNLEYNLTGDYIEMKIIDREIALMEELRDNLK